MGQVSGSLGAWLAAWFGVAGAAEMLTSLPSPSLGSFMSTAERVRLPDDCTVGYIVEGLLGVRLLRSPLFHSHLESLQRLPSGAVLQQVKDVLTWYSTPTRTQPGSQGVSQLFRVQERASLRISLSLGVDPGQRLCLLDEGPSGTCPWQVS